MKINSGNFQLCNFYCTFRHQQNQDRNPMEEMMAAEEAGQFVYIPAEEGGDSDPVSMDHSESSKASEDKTPASLPKSPKSPASPVKTHVSILKIQHKTTRNVTLLR